MGIYWRVNADSGGASTRRLAEPTQMGLITPDNPHLCRLAGICAWAPGWSAVVRTRERMRCGGGGGYASVSIDLAAQRSGDGSSAGRSIFTRPS